MPGDDEQPRHLGQVRDQILRQAVDEVFLLRIAAQIRERENGERHPVRGGNGPGGPSRRPGVQGHAVAFDRLRDVPYPLLAHRFEAEGELLLDLLRYLPRDADAAGVGELLQTRGDIHAFAVAILAIDDDLSEVDADADLDA